MNSAIQYVNEYNTEERVMIVNETHEGRTYVVTEVCPHCEKNVEMRWDTDTDGL